MSNLDVERRLTDVLHRHAEAAMIRTDTQRELTEFLTRGDQEPPGAGGPRRGRVLLGAAAAAAAVAGAAIWSNGLPGDRAEPPPAQQPTVDPVEVTERFVAAYAHNDIDTVAAMSADEADLSRWRIAMARDEAWGARFMVEPCRKVTTTDIGTGVVCSFSLHVLGSEEVGRGPFENATFTVWVDEDGGVFEADPTWNFEYNGMEQHVEHATSWVWAAHPDQTEFLQLDEPDVPPAQYDRWLELWSRYLQEYIDAHAKD